jgi:hypothetical protein
LGFDSRGTDWRTTHRAQALDRRELPGIFHKSTEAARFKQLWHIDAFAGRVSRTVRVEARKGDLFDAPAPERVAPRICSDCYRRRELRDFADQHQDRKIVVVKDDANRPKSHGWKAHVLFLLPTGNTSQQQTRRSSDIKPSKRGAITRILGTDAWERELYPDLGQADMFAANR